MAVVKGLKVGDLFTDGNKTYVVKSVNADGTYISAMTTPDAVVKKPTKKTAGKKAE